MILRLTGVDTFNLVMTPLDNPGLAFSKSGTLEGPAGSPIDWIELEMYNTDSDFYPDPVPDPAPTDFYISSIRISGEPGNEWKVDSNGDWSSAANWTVNVPGVGGAAVFGDVITAPRTVSADTSINVGQIFFDSANAYELAGSNTVTLDVVSGVAEIHVTRGSHTISAPLTLSDNTMLGVFAPNSNLSITGPIVFDSGVELIKGGVGRATLPHVRATALAVNGGTLAIAPNGGDAGTSVVEELSIGATSRLDLNNNDLIVRAAADTKDAIHADIQADIASAQNGIDANFITNWDGPGITSSFARTANVMTGFDLTGIGAIRNSDLDIITGLPGSSYTTFSGQPVTPDDVLVKYTYIGDGNLDGLVSFDDYVGMDNAFFALIPNLGWATGDINFDGVINFDDYTVVDQAFFFQGAPLNSGSVAAVPEPGTWVIVCLAFLLVPIAAYHFKSRQPT